MTIEICVFDAYGTLFDVSAAARQAATEPGREGFAERWQRVAETWRAKQLQYTWLRAAAGVHTDFWSITQAGLDYALEAEGIADPELRERLLALYWELSAFPEVPETLRTLKQAGRKTAILSNANPAMLSGAIESAGIGDLLDAALSVESCGVFKPDFRTYGLVGDAFGVPRRSVLFVSSNAWDAWGGAAFGFRSAWVNRKGEPMERLTTDPDRVVADLTAIPAIAAEL